MSRYIFARLEGSNQVIILKAEEGMDEYDRSDRYIFVEADGKLKLAKIIDSVIEHDCDRHSCYKFVRKITEEDENLIKKIMGKEKKAYRYCLNRIQIRQLPIKLIKVEFLLDNSKAIFYYSADGRIDFRNLVKDLAGRFKMRIEMRQIGIRDQAKLMGGIGPCGRVLCCCSFIREFEPVSIKIAKKQGLGFNINKLSGFCGRLMCCLQYEAHNYIDKEEEMVIELEDKDYIEEDMS